MLNTNGLTNVGLGLDKHIHSFVNSDYCVVPDVSSITFPNTFCTARLDKMNYCTALITGRWVKHVIVKCSSEVQQTISYQLVRSVVNS